ncbi:MAG: D-alanyl-D-alanine carboxypeptidase [Candidatus Nanopelagicales bacterium]
MGPRRHNLARVTAAVAATLVVAVPLLTAPAAAAAEIVGGPRLGTTGVVVGSGATALPKIDAASWMVVDLTTGDVLAAKAPHLRMRPASTLKTLTSVTLMPQLNPAAIHTVTAAEQAPVYGSRVGVVVGATYTIDQLWHGLLLPSGNDAAAALAAAYGGVPKTVAAMNAEAKHLQALDTKVINPSGLDANGQFISAYDMALFAQAALAIPEFVAVSHTISYAFPGKMAAPGKARPTYMIYGENRLLNHGYPGVIAGKTGYTTLAHRTFWVAANRGGHTVLVTLMNIGEATETAASKLMSWGLANAGRTGSVGVLVKPLGSTTGVSPLGTSGVPTATATASPATGAVGAVGTDKTRPVLGGLLVLVAAVAGLTFWRRRRARGPAPGAHAAGPSSDLGSGTGLEHVLPASPSPSVRVRAADPPPAGPSRPPSVIVAAPAPVLPPAAGADPDHEPAHLPEAAVAVTAPQPVAAEHHPLPRTGNVTVVRPARPGDLEPADQPLEG